MREKGLLPVRNVEKSKKGGRKEEGGNPREITQWVKNIENAGLNGTGTHFPSYSGLQGSRKGYLLVLGLGKGNG